MLYTEHTERRVERKRKIRPSLKLGSVRLRESTVEEGNSVWV